MAVKRITFEIDDSPDSTALTRMPESLAVVPQGTIQKEVFFTETPDNQPNYSDDAIKPADGSGRSIQEPVGRTPSDLVASYSSRPEFVTTAITMFSFVVFASKIQSLEDVILPLGISLLINCVWYGTMFVQRLLTRKRRT